MPVSCIKFFILFHLWQIPIALDMAKDFKGKDDSDLFKKITSDEYMHSAVVECYQTLREIITELLMKKDDRE